MLLNLAAILMVAVALNLGTIPAAAQKMFRSDSRYTVATAKANHDNWLRANGGQAIPAAAASKMSQLHSLAQQHKATPTMSMSLSMGARSGAEPVIGTRLDGGLNPTDPSPASTSPLAMIYSQSRYMFDNDTLAIDMLALQDFNESLSCWIGRYGPNGENYQSPCETGHYSWWPKGLSQGDLIHIYDVKVTPDWSWGDWQTIVCLYDQSGNLVLEVNVVTSKDYLPYGSWYGPTSFLGWNSNSNMVFTGQFLSGDPTYYLLGIPGASFSQGVTGASMDGGYLSVPDLGVMGGSSKLPMSFVTMTQESPTFYLSSTLPKFGLSRSQQ